MSKKDTEKKKTTKAKKPAAKVAATQKKTAAKDKKPASKKAEEPQAQPQGAAPSGVPYIIHTQYVRDVSFENPNALDSLRPGQPMPEMDINIGMDARRIEDASIPNFYEVALNVRAEAKRGDNIVFIAELQYGIAVSFDESVPQDTHHPVLLIEIPRFAFPYARAIMSDLTSQGGFPPLLLNPVDFQALYVQRFAKKTN